MGDDQIIVREGLGGRREWICSAPFDECCGTHQRIVRTVPGKG